MQAFEFLSPLPDFNKGGFGSHRGDLLGWLHVLLLSLEVDFLLEHTQWSSDAGGPHVCNVSGFLREREERDTLQTWGHKRLQAFLARGERLERNQEGEDAGPHRGNNGQE
jgi:hypothetical protein